MVAHFAENIETDMEAIYLPGELKENFERHLDLFEYKVLFLKSLSVQVAPLNKSLWRDDFIAMLPSYGAARKLGKNINI